MRTLLRRTALAIAIIALATLPRPSVAHADDACAGNIVKNGDTGCHLTQDNGNNTGNYSCEDNTSYTLYCDTLKPVPAKPTLE